VAQAAGQSWAGRGGSAPGGGTEDFPSLLPGGVSSSSSNSFPAPPLPSSLRPSQAKTRPTSAPVRPAEEFPSLPIRAGRPVAPVNRPAAPVNRSVAPAVRPASKPAAGTTKPTGTKPAKPVPKRIDPFDSDSGDDYPSLEVSND
jgi:hypothetical protein